MNTQSFCLLLVLGICTASVALDESPALAESSDTFEVASTPGGSRGSTYVVPRTYSTIINQNGDSHTLDMSIGAPRSYIGKDANGDFIMQVTPPSNQYQYQQQQTPLIIVPEINLPQLPTGPQPPVIQPRQTLPMMPLSPSRP